MQQPLYQVKKFNKEEWLTTQQVAEYFDVTRETVYQWIKKGYVPYGNETIRGRTGKVGRYYIHQSTLDWIDKEGRKLVTSYRKYFPRLVYEAKERGLL